MGEAGNKREIQPPSSPVGIASIPKEGRKPERPNDDKIASDGERKIVAVGDGITGSPNGDQDADQAVENALAMFQSLSYNELTGQNAKDLLVEAILGSQPNLATTLVATRLFDREAVTLHSGDSRLYAVEETPQGLVLKKLTEDQGFTSAIFPGDNDPKSPRSQEAAKLRRFISDALDAYSDATAHEYIKLNSVGKKLEEFWKHLESYKATGDTDEEIQKRMIKQLAGVYEGKEIEKVTKNNKSLTEEDEQHAKEQAEKRAQAALPPGTQIGINHFLALSNITSSFHHQSANLERYRLTPNTKFLMTLTDGVYKSLTPEQLTEVIGKSIREGHSPQQMAEAIVAAANNPKIEKRAVNDDKTCGIIQV